MIELEIDTWTEGETCGWHAHESKNVFNWEIVLLVHCKRVFMKEDKNYEIKMMVYVNELIKKYINVKNSRFLRFF